MFSAKSRPPAAGAATAAGLMTEADLAGADAPRCVPPAAIRSRRLRAGGINPRPDIRVTRTAPATALVDGDNGMGHLVMARAAATAIDLARETGIGWVGARRSNHAGAAGVYAALPLAHGVIGIYSVVASANHMPVWGGAETLLGTNPLAVAIPAGDEAPVVLDIATTVVSYGTVKSYGLQGRAMPEGWMVSSQDVHAADRSGAQPRRPAAAARRLQGQRARAGARAPGRPAQPRRLRPRRHRLQRRRGKRDQHRAFHRRARCRALHAACRFHRRGRPASA